MNEKILKLALDAGLLNYVDLETPPRYFVHGFAEVEDVEQFAESIVRECLAKCDQSGIYASKYDVADAIKDYFGVSE